MSNLSGTPTQMIYQIKKLLNKWFGPFSTPVDPQNGTLILVPLPFELSKTEIFASDLFEAVKATGQSGNQARRLILDGAVDVFELWKDWNWVVQKDLHYKIDREVAMKVGKKNFFHVISHEYEAEYKLIPDINT